MKNPQKLIRFTPEQHDRLCEIARRLRWSTYRNRDGFATLAREAIEYYLARRPAADQEIRRGLALDAADEADALGAYGSIADV